MPGGNKLGSRWSEPIRQGGVRTATIQPAPAQEDALLASAFRDLHGARLHGFAILLTLGDEQSAERAAGFALAAGAQQAAALRPPERAAAWLRARTLRGLQRRRRLRGSTPVEARRAALTALGVDEAVYRGLASLGIEARAALVASAIERFDPIDVETILDAAPAATRHTVARARSRYLRFASPGIGEDTDARPDQQAGEIASRVHSVAMRAFSTGNQSR